VKHVHFDARVTISRENGECAFNSGLPIQIFVSELVYNKRKRRNIFLCVETVLNSCKFSPERENSRTVVHKLRIANRSNAILLIARLGGNSR
jgi:hypothetical protein